MPADFSQYVDLTIHDVQPVDVYLGAIELARITMPEFTLRQGTPEDALFQAFAYMSSLSVGAINRLPSRLMEGLSKMLGTTRSYGARASVAVEFISTDNDGAYIPAGSIFSFSEKIAGDTYQYTFELAEDIVIDSVESGTTIPALAILYSQAIGIHPVLISGDLLTPLNVNVNLDTVTVWEDGVSTTGTVGSITGRLLQGSTTFTSSGTSIAGAATYTGVTQSATSGTGSGAVFTIAKAGGGTAYSGAITVTITSGGSGYAVGDTITIPGASLGVGATTPANNLTLTVATALGSPWSATVTNMSTTSGFAVGSALTATAGTGTLNGGSPTSVIVASIPTSTSMTYTVTGGTTPTAGTVTNVTGSLYPNPFTNGLEPEDDFTYLSRVRTHIASLSDVLVTASQLQAYVAITYPNISRCRVYDNTQSTDESSLLFAGATAGFATVFVYGVGQDLTSTERNSVAAQLAEKSVAGLTIGVSSFRRAGLEVEIDVVYDSRLADYDVESLIKSVIYNSLSPDNFPSNEQHVRTSYISSFLLGLDGIISVGNVVLTGTDANSDTNAANGDLPFLRKGTLPLISDIDNDITVNLTSRVV